MNANFPTTGGAGSASDIPPGTGYVYQDPPGTFASLASIPGADLDAGSVTNAKLQYSSVTLTQPAAGLTITSSVALGGTATFALANDLAAVEGLATTGFVKRTAADTWSTQTAISLATDVTGSLSGSSLTDATVTNAKLQNSSISFAQPAAGLTVTSSAALGGTATFALADDLAGIEAITGTGLVQRTGTNTYSTTTAPAISGANFTDYSIPNFKLQGGTLGRLLYDNGTGGQWLNAGTANFLLQSNGGASAPAWTNTPTGLQISGATNTLSAIPASALDPSFLLPVAKGGTGITTPLTTGALLYASTTLSWDQLAAGTSGYVLTSNGAGSAPSYKVPITDSTGSAEMSGSSYSVTSTTFANVGLTAPLPSAGKWKVTAEVRVQLQVSVGTGNVTLRMHDGTSAITKTERISPYSSGSVVQGATVPITTIVSVAGATNIDVQAAQGAGATYSSASVVTDGSGRSMIFWERLS